MKHNDFKIDCQFTTATGTWKCTDVGTRTIIAVSLALGGHKVINFNPETNEVTEHWVNDDWFNGPPYAVMEHVFDEKDIQGCKPV
jgi:hypothetical protein